MVQHILICIKRSWVWIQSQDWLHVIFSLCLPGFSVHGFHPSVSWRPGAFQNKTNMFSLWRTLRGFIIKMQIIYIFKPLSLLHFQMYETRVVWSTGFLCKSIGIWLSVWRKLWKRPSPLFIAGLAISCNLSRVYHGSRLTTWSGRAYTYILHVHNF